MADRSRYLLAYDIRDERRLRRVHDVAMSFGDPLQYSVFVCDLAEVERARLLEALRLSIDGAVDSVALFDLGPAVGRGLTCVKYLGAQRAGVRGGPRIW